MFKRVEKRARKKAKEAELGIDETTKELLGLNDTDDSESDSSDSESESGSDDGGASDQSDKETRSILNKLKRKAAVLENNSDDEAGSEDEGGGSGSEDEEGPPQPGAGEQRVTAQEALDNPLHDIPKPAGALSCAICPGKVFKNESMAEIHVASKAHERRRTRFVESTELLVGEGFDLREISAATVVAGMTDEPAFTKAAQIPSAKAKNKRPRDRGGKKRREAREQERLAAGLPLAGKPRTAAPARTEKPKIGKKAKQTPAAATTTRATVTTKPAAKRRKRAADS